MVGVRGWLCWSAKETLVGEVGGVGFGTGNGMGATCVGRMNVVSVGVTRMLLGGETLLGRCWDRGWGRSRIDVNAGEGVGVVDFGRGEGARGGGRDWAGDRVRGGEMETDVDRAR